MKHQPELPLSNTELHEAWVIMAERTFDAAQSASIDREAQLLTTGNYLIVCALSLSGEHSDEALQARFTEGLVTVGEEPSKAQQLAMTYTEQRASWYFFSLSHIPDSQTFDGLVRGRKGIWIEEEDFIRGIIASKTNKLISRAE
mgnify:FL=1